ncbi:MAG: Uma2 family endonuclease [Leptolyngbya sp. RL_3_1]|nr:Uma2 family endonuclease [Leptolyngbya sp. RL_3_1]
MTYTMGHSIPQVDPPRSPRETLPTMDDLPSEFPEEPGLPDQFHDLQPQLLSRTLTLADYRRENWFAGSDLNLYYDVHHPLWHKRPVWFLAVGVPHLYEGRELRRSYVTWQEGRSPHVVIEFLSPGTEQTDLGRFDPATGQELLPFQPDNGREQGEAVLPSKLTVYERYLRVPHYLTYDRRTQSLRYFLLVGSEYQEQSLQAPAPRVWLADLQIGLGLWEGTFEAVPGYWLRWCDRDGNWLLTDTEQERLAKERTQQRAERLAERLRALGIDPDSFPEEG